MKTAATAALLSALALTANSVRSDERPPADAKSMLTIVTQLEKDGYGPVTDVSFDDGSCEVEIVKDDVEHELNVDPLTGKVLSEHPDEREARPADGTQPLSKILTTLDEAGWTTIVEASYERNTWEVEAYQGAEKHELRVDAVSGKIVRDRLDD